MTPSPPNSSPYQPVRNVYNNTIHLRQCTPLLWGFSGGSVVKNLPANSRDSGWIPGWGRSPGEGNSNPLQYSCLENSTNRGAWWATVHRVTESDLPQPLSYFFIIIIITITYQHWHFLLKYRATLEKDLGEEKKNTTQTEEKLGKLFK